MPTLGEVYRQSLQAINNLDYAKLPIRLILMQINNIKTQEEFYSKQDENIRDLRRFTTNFTRFLNHEPVEYIINEATFLGYSFYVDNRVLIPRVETEEVVLKAAECAKELFKGEHINVADICSGSGVIGITFKHLYPNCNMTFIDISKDAIDVNKINLGKHNQTGSIYIGNSTDPLIENNAEIDMIISNPPYILNENEIEESVRRFEPMIALIDNKKLGIYENIFNYVKNATYKPKLLVFEIGYNTRNDLSNLVHEILPEAQAEFFKDINGKDRIMVVKV